MLLTQQIDPNEAELPSPMALKKKIILKVRKFVKVSIFIDLFIKTIKF